jgi:hypothetical protein
MIKMWSLNFCCHFNGQDFIFIFLVFMDTLIHKMIKKMLTIEMVIEA